MDNFEIDKEAKSLADDRSAYNLAREVVELREKVKQTQSLEGEGVLFSITFHQEGIQANYAIPGEVHEINVEGSVH